MCLASGTIYLHNNILLSWQVNLAELTQCINRRSPNNHIHLLIADINALPNLRKFLTSVRGLTWRNKLLKC